VRALSEKKKSLPEDVNSFIFVGKHAHENTLNQLLNFLEYIILSSGEQVSLGIANIDKLW
jgi:hypothetical protein